MTVEYITQEQIDRGTKDELLTVIATLHSEVDRLKLKSANQLSELALRDSELASLRSQLANRTIQGME